MAGWTPSRLFKTARKIDPSFDSIKFGKEKISHLLEALPSYFMLNRRGKSMMARRVPRAEEEIDQPLPPAEPMKAVEEAPVQEPVAPAISGMDVVRLVTKAFEATVKDDGRAFLPQMSKELKRIAPDVDFKTMGKSSLREYLEEYSDLFTLHKEGRNVYVSKRKGRRPARPISELVR